MLALAQMSAGWQAVCFVVACVLFLIAAVATPRYPKVNFIALGLFFFVFVYAWNAIAAS